MHSIGASRFFLILLAVCFVAGCSTRPVQGNGSRIQSASAAGVPIVSRYCDTYPSAKVYPDTQFHEALVSSYFAGAGSALSTGETIAILRSVYRNFEASARSDEIKRAADYPETMALYRSFLNRNPKTASRIACTDFVPLRWDEASEHLVAERREPRLSGFPEGFALNVSTKSVPTFSVPFSRAQFALALSNVVNGRGIVKLSGDAASIERRYRSSFGSVSFQIELEVVDCKVDRGLAGSVTNCVYRIIDAERQTRNRDGVWTVGSAGDIAKSIAGAKVGVE